MKTRIISTLAALLCFATFASAQVTLQVSETDSLTFSRPILILQRMGTDSNITIAGGGNKLRKLAFTKGELPQGRYTFQTAYNYQPVNFDFLVEKGDLTVTFFIPQGQSKNVVSFSGADAKLNDDLIDLNNQVAELDGTYTQYRRAIVNDANQGKGQEKAMAQAFKNFSSFKNNFISKTNSPIADIAAATWPNAQLWYLDTNPNKLTTLPHTLPLNRPTTWNANLMESKWQEYYKYLVPMYRKELGKDSYMDSLATYFPYLLNAAMGKDSLSANWQRSLGNSFGMAGMEEMTQWLDEKYKANACSAGGDEDLQQRLAVYRRMKKGNDAPPINIGDFNLSRDVKADTTLLVFWGTWCQHCEEQLPAIYTATANRKTIATVAIALDSEAQPWGQKSAAQFPNWKHLRAPGMWKDPVALDYGVTGTPAFFLLDKNKKIIGKFANIMEVLK